MPDSKYVERLHHALSRLEKSASDLCNYDRNKRHTRSHKQWAILHSRITEARQALSEVDFAKEQLQVHSN